MDYINLKKVLFLIMTALIIISLILTIVLYVVLNRTEIYKGITINEIDVSGLSRMEAVEKLRENYKEKLENSVLVLKYEDYIYKAKYEDLDVTYNYYKATERAYEIGRKGSFINRFKSIVKTKANEKNIELELLYKDREVDKLIENIRKDICIDSKDAEIELVNSTFKITPETIGRKINVETLKDRIIEGILKSQDVIIPVEKDIPKITETLLEKIKHPLAEFTTAFGGSSQARKNNIQVASLEIDGYLVLPGETFSFNKATGVRDRRAGYMQSKVIVDGRFVNDIGGGVCQVSTTLYNTALRSGMEIVERHHHSIPVGYVPKGEDATVSYDYLDLKFRNNYDFPVYISAIPTSYTITFRIYGGERKQNRYIDIESVLEEKVKPKIEKIVDKSLSPGARVIVQKGRYGYKVKTYRVMYENGEIVKRELISEDFYKPRKYILRLGPNTTQESSIQNNDSRARLVQ